MPQENSNLIAPARLIAGAMSGTSGDGVDVAITSITGRGPGMSATLVRHHHVPYDAALKTLLFEIRGSGTAKLVDLARLGREISLTYARAINETLAAANLHANDLAAVAAHGQTLYHEPPNSIQWLDPSLVAAEVGCAVISDFRRADLAAGGQGAPLVPYADYILFRHATKNLVLLNIGGIANITWLKAGGSIDDVIAFDTGPGNCISDYLARRVSGAGGGTTLDMNGERAARGRVHEPLVEAMLREPYFRQSPPKSTDGPAMIAAFEKASQEAPASETDDLFASACMTTARSIAHEIRRLSRPDELIISGGGVRNWAIMEFLRELLGRELLIRTTFEGRLAGLAKEAIAFALLGAATLDGEPSNVPSVTGAKRRVVLGSITPSPGTPGEGGGEGSVGAPKDAPSPHPSP